MLDGMLFVGMGFSFLFMVRAFEDHKPVTGWFSASVWIVFGLLLIAGMYGGY